MVVRSRHVGPPTNAAASTEGQKEGASGSSSSSGSGAPLAKESLAKAAEEDNLWRDLLDACPRLPFNGKVALRALPFATSLFCYYIIPALRVENGSVDACDPIRTYGQITQRGMETLLAAAGKDATEDFSQSTFLDIGSGRGAFPMFACNRGAFGHCVGVELQLDRHDAALEAWRSSGSNPQVKLILGNITAHERVFNGVRLAYWNNLCFSAEVSMATAQSFARSAPVGAELWTLARLPEVVEGLVEVEAISSAVEMDSPTLEMDWRDEPYVPIRYVRREEVRT